MRLAFQLSAYHPPNCAPPKVKTFRNTRVQPAEDFVHSLSSIRRHRSIRLQSRRGGVLRKTITYQWGLLERLYNLGAFVSYNWPSLASLARSHQKNQSSGLDLSELIYTDFVLHVKPSTPKLSIKGSNAKSLRDVAESSALSSRSASKKGLPRSPNRWSVNSKCGVTGPEPQHLPPRQARLQSLMPCH